MFTPGDITLAKHGLLHPVVPLLPLQKQRDTKMQIRKCYMHPPLITKASLILPRPMVPQAATLNGRRRNLLAIHLPQAKCVKAFVTPPQINLVLRKPRSFMITFVKLRRKGSSQLHLWKEYAVLLDIRVPLGRESLNR